MMRAHVTARLLILVSLVWVLAACSEGRDFEVQVRVTGLNGSGLVLLNNGTDELRVNSNGTHTFSEAYPFAYPYKISIRTNPASPDQLCTVTNDEMPRGGCSRCCTSRRCAAMMSRRETWKARSAP